MTCKTARCNRPVRAGGLCAKHYYRDLRSQIEAVERRIYPYDEMQLPRNRSSWLLHVHAVVLDTEGRWHDVAACSNRIRLGSRKIWRRPRTTAPPRLCKQCLQLMARHGFVPLD